MHEISICENILETLEEQAKAQAFSQVEVVRLEIGPLAGVELEALRFGFDVVMEGTLADGSTLEIIETKAEALCEQCAVTVTINQRYDGCPNCNHYPLKITSGDEMRIKDLEVV